MKKAGVIIFALIIGILAIAWLSSSQRKTVVNNKPEIAKTAIPTGLPSPKEENPQPSPENKLCSWVDNSDIIIKLTFADGVTKDTSYEVGFYYSSIGSDMRLARSACDYRTGFAYSEMKNKGTVQVGVRGYSDSNRRQLENEPINVVFDENGNPSLQSPIVVKVLN
ncbi:MAG: hypothetical protein WC686_02860 [Candidatus Shapirobacteria bacterium]|jgi:hypothetical protein